MFSFCKFSAKIQNIFHITPFRVYFFIINHILYPFGCNLHYIIYKYTLSGLFLLISLLRELLMNYFGMVRQLCFFFITYVQFVQFGMVILAQFVQFWLIKTAIFVHFINKNVSLQSNKDNNGIITNTYRPAKRAKQYRHQSALSSYNKIAYEYFQ